MQQIERMIQERAIAELVVGYPLNMNGSVGFKAHEVDAFIKDLEKDSNYRCIVLMSGYRVMR